MTESWAFFLVAAGFAVVTGANEGGAVISMGLQHPALRPIGSIAVLTAGVVVGPLLFGTGVAATLAQKLVKFQTGSSRAAFAVGLCGALVVVGILTARGLPTSLSIALIGGTTGSGIGYGLAISWRSLLAVLAFSAMAPIVGGIGGAGVARLLRCAPSSIRMAAVMAKATLAGYVCQAVAYGANGGQKMLAVFAVCTAGGLSLRPDTALIIAACFVAGTVTSLHRFAGRLGRDLLVVRPTHQLSAEVASAAAVFASMVARMPASMTESIASALIGAGVSESRKRIRWKAAGRLGAAWLVTLPGTMGVAVLAAAVVRGTG